MKKTNKRGYLVIALVVLLLALAIGYAAFSSSLTVNGTATGTGTWKVTFDSVAMSDAKHGTATKTDDNTITVNATLAYPGDGCTVTANIKNGGTIPAKLTAYTVTGLDTYEAGNTTNGTAYANDDIIVIVPKLTVNTEKVAAGETCPVTFAIQWRTTSAKTTGVSATFHIAFTYEQDTTAATVDAAHGTHTN